ncbi:MAG TPA: alpha/beta hydrolase [Burkholderiaceae bacterium]|nr:alpha/beta hydrolase [Burkholderiaceae bacterium]
MTYSDHHLTVDGIRAHYIQGGRGHPLLLIHGSGPGASTVGNWRRVLDPLAEHFHVYAMDLIGFGSSGRKPQPPYFDLELWLRQCRALIAQMPGPQIGVVGHSLSASLALKLAATEPRIAQVLTTGAMGAQFDVNDSTVRVWTFPATRDELRRTAEVLLYDKSLIDDAYLDARVAILYKDPGYGPYFASMFSGDRQAFADQAVLYAGDLTRISCKVAMLHGRDDVAFPPAITLDIARYLPQADVTLIGRCSHSIAMEYPEKLLSAARSLFPDESSASRKGPS